MNSDFISKHKKDSCVGSKQVKIRKRLTEGDQTTVEIIKELREVLNGKYNINVLSREEVRDLLDYLCTFFVWFYLFILLNRASDECVCVNFLDIL